MFIVKVDKKLALPDPNTSTSEDAVGVDVEVVLDGTETRVPLYQDAAGTVPLAQPLRTGARGFTQEFYAEVPELGTLLAWRSGGLQGGNVNYVNYAIDVAKDISTRSITGARGEGDTIVLTTAAGVDLPGILMPPGREGQPGAPGVLAVETSEAVKAYLEDESNPAGEAARAIAAGFAPAIRVNSQRYAIDDTGVVDATSALGAIFAAAPFGATVRLEGVFRLSGVVVIDPTKYLTIDFANSRFVSDVGSFSSLRCVGSFQAQVGVASITTETLMLENKSRTLVKLTMAEATGWVRGDKIKVIADDVIPAGHVTSATNKPRVGEFATVYSVSGTSVYLSAPLLETYTTNIRAARLNLGSLTVLDPQFDSSDARLSAKTEGAALQMHALIMPRIVRPRMRRLSGMGISMKSNYGYVIEDPEGDYAMDDTSSKNLGYFIHDSGCQDGRIYGGSVTGGRHAFTDGTGLVPAGSSDTMSYGATINAKWTAPTARGMKAACFDTHHMSLNTSFDNPVAYPLPEESAFLLRGRNASVNNPVVYGGATVVSVVTEITDAGGTTWSQGESYGHRLVNARSFGTKKIWDVSIRTHVNHPKSGVRSERVNLTVVGGEHDGLETPGFIRNGWVRQLGSCEARYGELAAGSGLRIANSIFDGDSLRLDGRLVTSVGSSQALVHVDDITAASSIVTIQSLRLAGSAAFRAGFPVPVNAPTTLTERLFIDDLLFENAWASTTPIATAEGVNASVRWRVLPTVGDAGRLRSSRALTYTNAGIEGTLRNLFRSHDERLTMTLDAADGVARTLSKLPEGKFTGQQLTILCARTGAAITVRNGADGGTALAGSTSKTLDTLGQTLDLFWSTTSWRQRVAV